MPTETGTIDLKAQKAGHDDAAKTATNYITADPTDGIKVHDSGDVTTFVQIASGVIDFVRSGVSAMKMWVDNSVAKVRVGLETAGHSVFSPEGMEVFADADTSVASFGAEGYRVGDESALHQVGDGTSLSFRNGSETVAYVSTDKFYSVNSEVEDAFYIGDYSIRNASDGKLVIGLRR